MPVRIRSPPPSKMKIKPIKDGNSNFDIVELGNYGKPYCKKHGAMLKVSEYGHWRCIRAINLLTGKCPDDCRAGCIEYHGECPKCRFKIDKKIKLNQNNYYYFCNGCEDQIASSALI